MKSCIILDGILVEIPTIKQQRIFAPFYEFAVGFFGVGRLIDFIAVFQTGLGLNIGTLVAVKFNGNGSAVADFNGFGIRDEIACGGGITHFVSTGFQIIHGFSVAVIIPSAPLTVGLHHTVFVGGVKTFDFTIAFIKNGFIHPFGIGSVTSALYTEVLSFTLESSSCRGFVEIDIRTGRKS